MCGCDAGEDVKHLLMTCGKFENRIGGDGELLEEYGRVCMEGKVKLLLGERVEKVSDTVMEEVDKCVVS